MWADALLRAEHLHLLRILAWGALTVVVGTALVVVATLSRARAGALDALGAPLAALGVLEIAGAGIVYRSAGLIDAAGAARLQNLVWFQLGLYAACALAGVLIAALARYARLRRALGSGVALAIHGAALVALTTIFIPLVSR